MSGPARESEASLSGPGRPAGADARGSRGRTARGLALPVCARQSRRRGCGPRVTQGREAAGGRVAETTRTPDGWRMGSCPDPRLQGSAESPMPRLPRRGMTMPARRGHYTVGPTTAARPDEPRSAVGPLRWVRDRCAGFTDPASDRCGPEHRWVADRDGPPATAATDRKPLRPPPPPGTGMRNA